MRKMDMPSVIQLSRLSVRFGRRTVINDFNAEFGAGDCAALIGGNGSGKTTLLRAIMGFINPAAGEVRLFGTPVPFGSGAVRRRRIAYVPQAPVLDFKMPIIVRDVVSMGRYAGRGIWRRLTAEDRGAVDGAMADTGIAHLADRPIGHLSGGERQKAQFARALCQAPDILLLDEPTGNLDLGAQHECLDLIGEIHGRRKLTTIIVMHDLQALPGVCNRALIIDDGAKVFEGRLAEVFTRENLAHIYKHRAARVISRLLDCAPIEDG